MPEINDFLKEFKFEESSELLIQIAQVLASATFELIGIPDIKVDLIDKTRIHESTK